MIRPVVLRDLLREKHWQTYPAFCREYDRAAAEIDRKYVGTYPSRAQLHRWLSGNLKGTPHPHHCEVLEKMFPGVSAAHMFEPSYEDVVDALPAEQQSEECSEPGQNPSASNAGLLFDEPTDWEPSSGNLVDLSLQCSIEIDTDGWAVVSYKFVLLNLTDAPVRRLLREQWFETTDGVRICPGDESDRKVSIQRIHDIGNMTKFACVFSPSIEPGEIGTVSYTTHGGRFVHDHFWQQSAVRHTKELSLNIRHQGVDMLFGCTAIEDHSDGTQVSIMDDLDYHEEDGGALVTLTRRNVKPGQSVTVRWETS